MTQTSPNRSVKKYLDLYHRLRALSQIDLEDPDPCWLWTGRLVGRTGNYPRLNVWAGGKQRQLAAHRVALVAQEILDNGGDWSLFWPLYHLYSIAGFEADHDTSDHPTCGPTCVNSCHLVWREKDEHRALTIRRRRERQNM